ncbi:STAS/SEC14 domain-containing protein [Zobellia nedashkovskayae]|uniref:STAS/SEC14 domain-containing protein n=1 Tax=Zobellia nedashkovskayae TaxID=2779510 RepID=UPI00188A9A5F|nr:STAS/SEC14 domain-containing protein [Zobellia nedashkovskayae]
MIEKIKTYKGNTLALEVIDEFTGTDEKLAQKFFKEKVEEGFDYVNVLVKLDELNVSKSKTKVFMEDIIWILRNYRQIGNIAIVAHSKILKALIPIDNIFFERLQKGYQERYFDITQLEEAFQFVAPNEYEPS